MIYGLFLECDFCREKKRTITFFRDNVKHKKLDIQHIYNQKDDMPIIMNDLLDLFDAATNHGWKRAGDKWMCNECQNESKVF